MYLTEHSTHRSYLKQLQLACLPGQEREDSGSKGKSIVSLSLEGLQSILTLSTRLEEDKCLGILTFISSSEDTEASLSATSLHLIRKFQVQMTLQIVCDGSMFFSIMGLREANHVHTSIDYEDMGPVELCSEGCKTSCAD